MLAVAVGAFLLVLVALGATIWLLEKGGGIDRSAVREDFEGHSLNTSEWSKSEKVLGRSRLDADNVSVRDGKLVVRLPADTLEGGEVASRDFSGYGSYAVRMKVPNAPSSITGFFLYRAPDFEHEVDVEVRNDPSGEVAFTTYLGGSREPTNTEIMLLPFDPTAGFHTYRFDYRRDSVQFFADGKLVDAFSIGTPKETMRLRVNAWYPEWMGGKQPASDEYLYVDWIQMPEAG